MTMKFDEQSARALVADLNLEAVELAGGNPAWNSYRAIQRGTYWVVAIYDDQDRHISNL